MGSAKALRYLISGGNEDIVYMPNLESRSVYITMPALYWIMPDEEYFKGAYVIKTDDKMYSIDDYQSIFEERNDARGYEVYKNSIARVFDPLVEFYPIYGINKNTEAFFEYP